MSEVRFYHLTTVDLETALPQLLEKTLERGKRALVLAGSQERVEALADWLWRYDDRGFLPHGTAKDGRPEDQPIWLGLAGESASEENPNAAGYLFLTDGATSAHLAGYERTSVLFDGNDPERLQQVRGLWRSLKDAGHGLSYWQQDERGRWTQKAEG